MILLEEVPEDSLVTPGVGGFAVFALLAVAVILLSISMSRHLRKIDARAAQEEADEAARAAAEERDGEPSQDSPPTAPEPSDAPQRDEP